MTNLPISETMSVNEILRRYPRAEPLFRDLHVNRLQEGYESVDEVAWRHGMDLEQLLKRLRQAARAGRN
jgi:iron-sulfur cluster repair protein YtfE (RIC family)